MTDAFRVPLEVTYAIEGGEPALMAYRRWRNICAMFLPQRVASPKMTSARSRMARGISRRRCLKAFRRCRSPPGPVHQGLAVLLQRRFNRIVNLTSRDRSTLQEHQIRYSRLVTSTQATKARA